MCKVVKSLMMSHTEVCCCNYVSCCMSVREPVLLQNRNKCLSRLPFLLGQGGGVALLTQFNVPLELLQQKKRYVISCRVRGVKCSLLLNLVMCTLML